MKKQPTQKPKPEPKREKPLNLDMSFEEAIKRLAQTDPKEIKKQSLVD